MKFIVIFHEDKEIVEVEREDVNLHDFSSFTIEDWKSFPQLIHPVVKVWYENKVWDTTILQASVVLFCLLYLKYNPKSIFR
jgi:hypothetical protein